MKTEFPELQIENTRIWDSIAEWWDDRIGDGNDFQTELIEPTTHSLLELKPDETVLDIACGAGRMARLIAEAGSRVVAFDHSEKFIQRAKTRTDKKLGIEYHVIDATDREALIVLGENRFDCAVCTMGFMDMPAIEPLFAVLPSLLKSHGRLVFSVAHPCFHSARIQRFAEMYEQEAGRHVFINGIKVSGYLGATARKTEGILGQPEPQYYFHRSLQDLFGVGFKYGFVIDALKEPAFQKESERQRTLKWDDMPEIPPLLVVRMRLNK